MHDVSWGTKGDHKVSTDLGVVSAGKGTNEVEVSVPTAETDINAAYEDAMQLLRDKPPKAEPKVDLTTKQEDYYKTFRTNVRPPLCMCVSRCVRLTWFRRCCWCGR